MRPTRRVHAVVAARERFLEDGDLEPDVVRQPILASWRRSRLAGVDAHHFDVPYQPDLDLAGALVHHARPVLDRLETQLSDMSVCAVLTDTRGRILDRRVGDNQLLRMLDDISLAPGFSYAEAHAGTNGVGTALEGRGATMVVGAEHFTDRLQPFACAGAPIRNPVSGRVEGIIDITTLSADANPTMRLLALEAANDVERELRDRSGHAATMVMREFVTARMRTKQAVIAVAADFFITCPRAAVQLTAADQEYLRDRAVEFLENARETVSTVVLSQGPSRLRCTHVLHHARPVGAILEITFGGAAPASRAAASRAPAAQAQRAGTAERIIQDGSLPGLAGTSPAWQRCCREVRLAAAHRSPLIVLGEDGVGKLAMLAAAHQERWPTSRLRTIECAAPAVADRLREALDDHDATVVLRHLDRMEPAAATAVDTALRERPPGAVDRSWLVATATSPTTSPHPVLDDLLGHFAASVTVPALRHRPDDISAMVAALLRRIAPGRRLSCSADAVRALCGYRWPGNAAELEVALRSALTSRPVGQIGLSDLPARCLSSSRRLLSRLESSERDLIIEALRDAGGNRAHAAVALGIGRATLYRRLKHFGIDHVRFDIA
ncbi:sigma-54-dependent Fis family transcriptional regulator [Pseudonocardia sp. GCM10023141]|uniref:sigma-54-dependent Fis family transcriptional regulator n=1 Tax=Pseudonocardia sp. GCM10023141 TaxID=3252653 RepID=UPI00361C88A5